MNNPQPAIAIPTTLTLSNRDQGYEIPLSPVTKNPERHRENDHIVVHLSDCNNINRLTIGIILNSTTIQQGSLKEFIIHTLEQQINKISNHEIRELYDRGLANAGQITNIPYSHIRSELISRIKNSYSNLAIKRDNIPQEYMLYFTNLFGVNNYYKEIPRADHNNESEQIGEC